MDIFSLVHLLQYILIMPGERREGSTGISSVLNSIFGIVFL